MNPLSQKFIYIYILYFYKKKFFEPPEIQICTLSPSNLTPFFLKPNLNFEKKVQ